MTSVDGRGFSSFDVKVQAQDDLCVLKAGVETEAAARNKTLSRCCEEMISEPDMLVAEISKGTSIVDCIESVRLGTQGASDVVFFFVCCCC